MLTGRCFMKYKLLLGGENSMIIRDFFCYTEKYFRCLTTTNLFNDVCGHFEFFQPDVYVLFLDAESCEDVRNHITVIRENGSCKAAVAIVGKEEICDEIRQKCPWIANMLIKRPVSPDNLALSIIDYLENDKSARAVKEEVVVQPQQKVEKKHILVVDDDRTVLKVVKSILENNYDVTSIINGTLVEKILATRKVDVIVLDYEMPIMTGVEVYRKIKQNPDTKNIPICFLTGVSERSKVEEIMALKPRGYLLKPINAEMLLATMSNLTST